MLFWGLCVDDNMQIKGEVQRGERGCLREIKKKESPVLIWTVPSLSRREGWPGGLSPWAQITVINLHWRLAGKMRLCSSTGRKMSPSIPMWGLCLHSNNCNNHTGWVLCHLQNALTSVITWGAQRNSQLSLLERRRQGLQGKGTLLDWSKRGK